jgi:hypothetical protein
MIAVVALLAFFLGFRMRSRLAANVTYAFAYLWAFTFQTLYLLVDSMSQDSGSPAFRAGEFPLSYGAVTLAVFGAGFGLVALGRRAASGRSWRAAPVAAH